MLIYFLLRLWGLYTSGCSLPANSDQATTAWWSQPFNHECLQKCGGEIIQHLSNVDIALRNQNCSIACEGNSVRSRSFSKQKLEQVILKNPQSGEKSKCWIQTFQEEITCASPVGSGKFKIDTENQCLRRNYKYYLPHQICDDIVHPDVGEETCREACVDETSRRGRKVISINIGKQRAVFRICYEGMLSDSRKPGRTLRENFCRADLRPCSSCFQWANWTSENSCSRTCGSPGIKIFVRSCLIMERTDLYGDTIVWNTVHSAYCSEHLGGMNKKTEPCGSYTACPGWTRWGPWSECPNLEVSISSADNPPKITRNSKQGCRRKVRSAMNSDFTSLQNGSGAGAENVPGELQVSTQGTELKNETSPLKDGLMSKQRRRGAPKSRRTRKCLPIGSDDSLCQGSSTQYKSCRAGVKSTTPAPDDSNTDDCEEDSQPQSTTALKGEIEPWTTERTRISQTENETPHEEEPKHLTTRPGQTGSRGGNKNNDAPVYTLSDDGFTNVINTYAPALIAGLLIFIVLLLAALIAICGARVMQKSRRNRYDLTSPSFSGGTMGSIPSGFVHGFSHVLGLRHGSGTFGRSEGTANGIGGLGDIENRGSCRSVASSANSRGRTKQPHTGFPHTANSIHAGSSQPRIPLTELGKGYSESNMGSKKPSNSSLLSSGSSLCGLPPPPPYPTSFHPLPPIPPTCPPKPLGNNNSVFKRGAKKSASLNPSEMERKSKVTSQTQPRAESVSGRVFGIRHEDIPKQDNSVSQRYSRAHARKNVMKNGSDVSSSESYCRHNCEAGKCDVSSDTQESENEYWSVKRPECSESEDEDPGPLRSSNQNTPRAKPRSTNKSLQTERQQKNGESKTIWSVQDSKGGCAQVEMIDNVLYAQKKNAAASEGEDEDTHTSADLPRGSSDDLASETEKKTESPVEEERVYNTIGMEEPIDIFDSELVTTTEGDYDHLCDQFGGPHSTKGRMKYPGTMTSLHYLRNNGGDADDNSNTHDYESIELAAKHCPREEVRRN